MKRRGLACLMLLAAAWPAWAERASVRVDTGLTGIRVEAAVTVQADPATLWATLTDYDRLASFIPNLVVSRVVSPPGQPPQVEQRAHSGLFSFALPDHVVLLLDESAPRRIRFRALSGSVISMTGEWRVEGEGRPVRLTYRAHVVPYVPPPPLISDGFIEDEIRLRFEAVAREAERRMKADGYSR